MPANYIVWALAIKDSNVFAGTQEKGVFISSTNQNNWISINNTNGITKKVYALTIKDSSIYVGTAYGIWKRPLSDFVSVKENTLINNNGIYIYPNPTKDNLTIETNSNKEQSIEILNLMGQTVYTSNIYKKAIINTSAFANGVYILKLSSDKEIVVRKFVKE